MSALIINSAFSAVESIEKHSSIEQRYNALSATFAGKMLFIVFMIRNEKIRVISARPMNKKEREVYNEKIKDAPEV